MAQAAFRQPGLDWTTMWVQTKRKPLWEAQTRLDGIGCYWCNRMLVDLCEKLQMCKALVGVGSVESAPAA
jgi:hypothetical protein